MVEIKPDSIIGTQLSAGKKTINMVNDALKNVSRTASDTISNYIIHKSDENGMISTDITGLDEDLDVNTIINNGSTTLPVFNDITGVIIDTLDNNTKDGAIGYTKQCATGDCWLLSTINALSYTDKGREIIKDALEYTDNGVIVHLKGVGDYTISNLEIAQTKSSYQYSDGDDDMIAFERAVEDALDDIAKANFMIEDFFAKSYSIANYNKIATHLGYSSTSGGTEVSALYLITSKEGGVVFDKNSMEDYLDKFQKNNGKDFVLTANVQVPPEEYKEGEGDIARIIKPDTAVDIYGNTIELARPHAYAIKKVDDSNVTFVNPWDSSKEYTISREVFLDKFNDIQYCNLSDNNPEVNLVEKPLATRDNGDKLFLKETNVKMLESEFDNEGTYTSGMELSIYSKDGECVDSTFASFDDILANQEAFNNFIKNAFDNFNKNGSIWEEAVLN